eukprot:GFYU01005593.1.p1 GENE.GFYU01005593.1~~GFYU01005593.1.p1  ORF type:complete len:423 (+),score=77.79 GFYU01005593.1:23-1270(+)
MSLLWWGTRVTGSLSGRYQRTLAQNVSLSGIGLHTGEMAKLTITPAPPGTGIVFQLVTSQDGTDATSTSTGDQKVPPIIARGRASYQSVTPSDLCTTIQLSTIHGLPMQGNVKLNTVEHLLAALRGSGVDNAAVYVEGGSEVPILDGSALPFVEAFDSVGYTLQDRPRKYIRVLKEVQVADGSRQVSVGPTNADIMSCVVETNFEHKGVGAQRIRCDLTFEEFRTDICSARTFTFDDEIAQLKGMGLIKGGSLDTAVVYRSRADPSSTIDSLSASTDASTDASDGAGSSAGETVQTYTSHGLKVLNPEGLRFRDEICRHKVLDVIGDLSLGGYIVGRYEGTLPGHSLHNKLLHALFSDPANYTVWTQGDGSPDREHPMYLSLPHEDALDIDDGDDEDGFVDGTGMFNDTHFDDWS